MTFTFNGIGTTLSGDRWLNGEEYLALARHKDFKKVTQGLMNTPELKIETKEDLFRFRIATKSFSVLFIPIIPLETFIYYYPKVKWYQNNKYIPLFYTRGNGKVDWKHVKKSWSFYVLPLVVFGIISWKLFSLF